jgi:peptidoglycan/xylan/chitin deacetylase (PgdA/CDA1 family)
MPRVASYPEPVRAPLLIAAGAAAGYGLPLPAAHVPRLARPLGIATTLVLPGPHLTFEDGPHPEATPKVLELLREHELRATFFLLGEQVRRTGALRDEIEAAGHGIAMHGDTHRALWRLTPRALKEDLDRAQETIRPTAELHRAPYGAYSLPALYEVMHRGLNPLLWSRAGRDVTRDLGARDVLLLRDASDIAALPAVLEAVIAARDRRPGSAAG